MWSKKLEHKYKREKHRVELKVPDLLTWRRGCFYGYV